MYGECGPSQNDAVYNCKYNGAAKPLQPDGSKLLQDLCPHLYNGENKTNICCDTAQLSRLYNSIKLPRQLMSRCPACYRNFKAFLCDMTCGPNQSDFLLVTGESWYNKTKEVQITSYTYYITNYYTDQLFDSCKYVLFKIILFVIIFIKFLLKRDVQYSASGQKILDIMCGSPTDGCTPKAFVDYLGDNPDSPFVFKMNITDTEYDYNSTLHLKPINTTMSSCSKSVDLPFFKAGPCGCSDCTDSCPKPVPPPVIKQCKLWGMQCLDVAYFLGFAICTIFFLLAIFLTNVFIEDKTITSGNFRLY